MNSLDLSVSCTCVVVFARQFIRPFTEIRAEGQRIAVWLNSPVLDAFIDDHRCDLMVGMKPQANEPRRGRRVLIVEDEYFIADDLRRQLQASGVEVIGPVGEVSAALSLLEGTPQLDGALVDINLRGELAFAVADALMMRRVPFVFTTCYDHRVIPARYADVTLREKPVDTAEVALALFGPE